MATKNLLIKNWLRKQLSNRLINCLLCNSLSLTFFFPFIAFTMIKDAQLFVHCCKNDHASDRISTSQLICMISFRLYFFISCCIYSDFIQVLFVVFFILACIISSNDFVSLLILNLRIKGFTHKYKVQKLLIQMLFGAIKFKAS